MVKKTVCCGEAYKACTDGFVHSDQHRLTHAAARAACTLHKPQGGGKGGKKKAAAAYDTTAEAVGAFGLRVRHNGFGG